ncbi:MULTISPECIES: putative 2-aminoethylphosphonate ABC transporter permease subunit [Roseomonadaceae]|uniref:2-aminoethylphosphonate ABC transporter permease subunit n=1 Tax=Falsiroseomonas oleicola TaxID=2801474 RepID=A0ABS6H785_9PROT|nr:putative 2-aminoethylphosphonate ABC transporter permease subunit [Roseomonas oleicola]MBU8544236.1 putative 2-aminoethylphosphonate ABC transporter permease subunit [Roseomonas oleicola]
MSDAVLPARAPSPVVVPLEARLLRFGLLLALAVLVAGLVLPLGTLLLRAFQDPEGSFVGLRNFAEYATTPSLRLAAWNSLWTAALTTLLVVPLAFGFAYALTRACIPAKGFFRAVMLLPVLAPSLLPALALIYLFGNQGMLRELLFGNSIYGPIGIIVAQVFYCFPHAALILVVALSTSDARLYEAATVLRAGHLRIFGTVTLPMARYGLVSASVVVFTLVVTDFGIPKVIGGQFPVLATDVYKQVVGLQNFNMGAVVGLVLLLPALLAFAADRWANRQRSGLLSGRAVPYVPRPRRARDLPLLALCLLVAVALVGLVAVAVWGSLVTFWPYNLNLTLQNYDFDRFDTSGWAALWNSVRIAATAAIVGTALIFGTAWLLERGAPGGALASAVRFIAGVPLAVPGLVLGLAFILFFNHPANPLGFLYGTLAILVLNGVVHFYTVMHLTAVTAIRQLDPEFESVGASLKVPAVVTFGRVTVPICLPAILDIAVYAFVNVMTTVSAVIFLYGPDTKPASVAVVHMDEAGQSSAAAAMAVTILAITASVKLAQIATTGAVNRLTQGWRAR